MCQHVFASRNIRQEDTVEIDVDDLQPLFIRHLLCRCIDANACVVVAEVQAAEFRDDFLDHCINLLLAGAVRLDGDDLAARLLCQLRSRLLRRLDVEINDSHICACLSKRRSRAFADAARSARNETLLARQCHFLKDTHDTTSFLFSYFVKSFFKSAYIITVYQHIVKRENEKIIDNTIEIGLFS